MPSSDLVNRIHLLETENEALRKDKQGLIDVMERWSEEEAQQHSNVIRPNASSLSAGTGAPSSSDTATEPLTLPAFKSQHHTLTSQGATILVL